MLKWRYFSRIEKALIVFAAFTALSVLAYGLNYRFRGEPVKESVPSIGAITHQKNDTRYRPFNSFAWAPSERAQSIRTGDSVFARENSAAQMSLREDGDVVIGANSLVAFNKINKERMANLLQGNFKIVVRGQAKIAIRGKVTKISGKNSEIQLFTGSDLKPTPVQAPLIPEVKAQEPPPALKAPEANPRSLTVKDFWVWLGMGVNYTSNTQSVQGFSDIEYGKIRSPSMMVKAGFFASDRFGVDLGYKTTPGEAKSSPSLSVRNGAYTWQTMSVEGLYRSERDLSKATEWVWRLGLQQHQFPFMVPESSSVINLTENSMTNVSLGFEYKRKIRERLRFEWLMRYQRPISQSSDAGASLSITPQFAFDGSLGSAYEIRENLFLGVYWYGQYQKFDFNYRDNGSLNFSGQQSLFFTNFDLRLGWEF